MHRLIPTISLTLLLSAPAFGQQTSFTYQGQLKDDGIPADGSYNLVFKLFSASSGGSQVGSTITRNGVVLTNGLFNQTLDFGTGAFTGQPRWLEITVSGVVLGRQPLTATPYALYALTGPGGSGPWQASGANIFNTNTGNVGIGTSTPAHKLTVRTPTLDYGVEHTDGDTRVSTFVGRGSGWLGTLSNHKLTLFANDNGFPNMTATLDTAGRFGIGTDSPLFTLHVEGDEFLSGDAFFGQLTRQMLNLYGTGFGIGIQDAVLYNRSGGAFYWYQGGTHQNATGNAGGGLALLSLDQLGIHFGARLGQFVRLWEDGVNYYGSGVQAGTHYFRTGGQPGDAFAWHKGGVHNDNPRNPGGGQTLMTLDGENGLAVSGNATQAREKGGFVKAMAKVDANGFVSRQYSALGGTITASTVVSVHGTAYYIVFPFQVNDRFISVSPFATGTSGTVAISFGFNSSTEIYVLMGDITDPQNRIANDFFIFVY